MTSRENPSMAQYQNNVFLRHMIAVVWSRNIFLIPV